MKILFLVGSMEPGRSGVGDYARLLSRECATRGHECELVALYDPFTSKLQNAVVQVGGVSIRQQRMPVDTVDRDRLELLAERLERFSPDWISLQFVTYAFQNRGLIWPKLAALSGLLRSWRLHLMFHELWIGAYHNAPWRERAVGWLQKTMVKRFLTALAPKRIHTSTPLYCFLLERAGFRATVLPMFGTITADTLRANTWLLHELVGHGVPADTESLSSCWLVGFFGSMHAGFPYRVVMPELARAGKELGRRVIIISAGNAGPGFSLWNEMAGEFDGTIHFVSLGQLSEAKVSQLFNTLDVGITTTPLDIIGKSSSVASMLDHGLPVLVAEEGKSGWVDMPQLDGVFTKDQFFGERKYAEPLRGLHRRSIHTTTAQFLADLCEDLDTAELKSAPRPSLAW